MRSFTTRLLYELAQANHLLQKDGNRHQHSVEILSCKHPMCRAVVKALYISSPSHEENPDRMFGCQEEWEALLAEMNEYAKIEVINRNEQSKIQTEIHDATQS